MLEKLIFYFMLNLILYYIFIAELSEVRKYVAVQRNAGVYQPYKIFGRGSTSVQISDIARGLWCEQQVEYGHLYPYLRRTEGWRRAQAEKKTVIQRRTAAMKAGSHIHYKKGRILNF